MRGGGEEERRGGGEDCGVCRLEDYGLEDHCSAKVSLSPPPTSNSAFFFSHCSLVTRSQDSLNKKTLYVDKLVTETILDIFACLAMVIGL